MAEDIANNEESRKTVRAEFRRTAMITSKVVKSKKDEEESAKYADYFEFSEPLKRCPSHRVMAMLRAEKEGVVKRRCCRTGVRRSRGRGMRPA